MSDSIASSPSPCSKKLPFTPSKNPLNPKSSICNQSVSSTRFLSVSSFSQFSNIKLITRSSSSIIFSGRFQSLKYAIKQLKSFFTSPKEIETFLIREKKFTSLRSPFILFHRFSFVERGRGYIITDLCDFGNLKKLLLANSFKHIGAKILLFRQVSEGIKNLHNQDITHSDIKLENIFVEAKSRVKIGDLELAQIGADNEAKKRDIIQLGRVFEKVIKLSALKTEKKIMEDVGILELIEEMKKGSVEIGVVCKEVKEMHKTLMKRTKGKKSRKTVFENIIKSKSRLKEVDLSKEFERTIEVGEDSGRKSGEKFEVDESLSPVNLVEFMI